MNELKFRGIINWRAAPRTVASALRNLLQPVDAEYRTRLQSRFLGTLPWNSIQQNNTKRVTCIYKKKSLLKKNILPNHLIEIVKWLTFTR